MKFIWEPQDIQPGVRYSRKDISEVWMISWIAFEDHPDRRWTSVSLNDGMVCAVSTKEEIATLLNSGGYIPLKFMEGLR